MAKNMEVIVVVKVTLLTATQKIMDKSRKSRNFLNIFRLCQGGHVKHTDTLRPDMMLMFNSVVCLLL